MDGRLVTAPGADLRVGSAAPGQLLQGAKEQKPTVSLLLIFGKHAKRLYHSQSAGLQVQPGETDQFGAQRKKENILCVIKYRIDFPLRIRLVPGKAGKTTLKQLLKARDGVGAGENGNRHTLSIFRLCQMTQVIANHLPFFMLDVEAILL